MVGKNTEVLLVRISAMAFHYYYIALIKRLEGSFSSDFSKVLLISETDYSSFVHME